MLIDALWVIISIIYFHTLICLSDYHKYCRKMFRTAHRCTSLGHRHPRCRTRNSCHSISLLSLPYAYLFKSDYKHILFQPRIRAHALLWFIYRYLVDFLLDIRLVIFRITEKKMNVSERFQYLLAVSSIFRTIRSMLETSSEVAL